MNRPTILDPRFRYVPSLETDVAATWRRFGFKPEHNKERRARLLPRGVETPPRVAAQR
jgi:hypothetical protein